MTYSLRHLMSGRIIYFVESLTKKKEAITTHLVHPNDDRYKEERDNEKYGLVLLECLESNLVDGALTRLSIDNGRQYMEVKSLKKNELAIRSKDEVEDESEMQQINEMNKEINFDKDNEVEQTYESNFEKETLEAVKDASEHGFRIYKID